MDFIIIVKDNVGNVYLSEYSFNGICDLIGGYDYQFKITESVSDFNICD